MLIIKKTNTVRFCGASIREETYHKFRVITSSGYQNQIASGEDAIGKVSLSSSRGLRLALPLKVHPRPQKQRPSLTRSSGNKNASDFHLPLESKSSVKTKTRAKSGNIGHDVTSGYSETAAAPAANFSRSQSGAFILPGERLSVGDDNFKATDKSKGEKRIYLFRAKSTSNR